MFKRMSKGEVAFLIFDYALLSVFAIIIILPIFSVVLNSFRDAKDILTQGYTIIPKSFNLEAYKFLLVDTTKIWMGLKSSIVLTVVGTALCLVFTTVMAYPLSKKYLPGRNGVMVIVFITMFFSGGLVPSYLLITSLGMKDSIFALIVPSLISAWNMILMRNFYYQIPDDIEESAKIEGANDWVIFLKMYLPLSLPSMATIGLFYAVGFWNSWFGPSIYLDTASKFPLQLVLKTIMGSMDVRALADKGINASKMMTVTEENIKAAAIVITAVPILIVYPFIQKYFVKGIYVGSVKG